MYTFLSAMSLNSACILAVQAREQGALPEDALARLRSVEGTGVLETMAAMDAINGLEPLAMALRRTQRTAARCAAISPSPMSQTQ